MKILYDGWPLVYKPNSPSALHLLGILSALPPDVEPLLALPGEPPPWLPPIGTRHIHQAENTPRQRLTWEQRTVPALLRQTGAALLHATSSSLPLFAPGQSLVSPANFEERSSEQGFWERLRMAAAQGGTRSLGGWLWPDDLPSPGTDRRTFRLPPFAYPLRADELAANEEHSDRPDLPEGYVLYHGPSGEADLRSLLNAWSWAAASVGDVYPLVAIGLEAARGERLLALAEEFGLGETVRSLPALSPTAISHVYQRSAALFHPAEEPPWGGPVRLALAHGKPVVSAESARTSALVGPAAYLVRGDESRLLGAALITVLLEEKMAEQLAQAGGQRAAAWSPEAFGQELAKTYKRVIER